MSDPLDAWKPWPKCPADGCEETEGVLIMECAPGHTYMTTGDVCEHWVTLHFDPARPLSDEQRAMWDEYFRPSDVPRETSTE